MLGLSFLDESLAVSIAKLPSSAEVFSVGNEKTSAEDRENGLSANPVRHIISFIIKSIC